VNSDFIEQDQSQQVRQLEEFSRLVLSEYGIQAQEITSINYEYNVTFKIVSLDGKCFALRININSPRSSENIRGEIAWVKQLCEKFGTREAASKMTTSIMKETACSPATFVKSLGWLAGTRLTRANLRGATSQSAIWQTLYSLEDRSA
jgi:hypothetical protein